ncbi:MULTISPECIES: PTS system mannose/fructose/N-acetylgalactosamine-transporter subunit IIB [Enterococcus]|uniref:PTS system, D-glucosaminate-specific IIB component n=1 Tax=Candidatus Enterococcus ferrettii TaxID=2815324 RepID=A0ABV0EPB0_9ENTE|nr:PTS sugar transporter subunit IIB [Enterococcus sp. 665A]MBO1340925.1 PTS sugar transporter subunit IIB [Enterococcus sp. 665A]
MDIKLIRMDYRLIHGQVVTKWVKQMMINRIIIVNDELASNDFLAEVYEMAAPAGIKVDIYGVNEICQKQADGTLGEGNVLLLLKDVGTALELAKLGFPLKEIQIGGLGGKRGGTTILPGISFSKEDVAVLEELKKRELVIYLNVLPSEPTMSLEKALEKFYS